MRYSHLPRLYIARGGPEPFPTSLVQFRGQTSRHQSAMASSSAAPPAEPPAAGPSATEPSTTEPSAAEPTATEPTAAEMPQVDVQQVHVEVESHDVSDSDSAYGDDLQSYTTSLKSTVLNYRFENGRRYHAYKDEDAKYAFPNDDEENDRLDLYHHIQTLSLGGKLHLAPIGETPGRVLDVGTGTGIWAIGMLLSINKLILMFANLTSTCRLRRQIPICRDSGQRHQPYSTFSSPTECKVRGRRLRRGMGLLAKV